MTDITSGKSHISATESGGFVDSGHAGEATRNPVEEFRYYLDKSQQLFAGLRELPHTGRNWQPYFQRTFEVYTKLWKHQQIHRSILEKEYGLKRWEIGELASKIGQLYYHYYLRTSETNYLQESYTFYEAVHHRQYFKNVLDTKQAPLMIKKLRFYARFIVVCLLLNRTDMIKTLTDELGVFVDEYQNTFKPFDGADWNVVLSEIGTFLEAEKKLSPLDPQGKSLLVPSRLQIDKMVKFEKGEKGENRLKLQEAILVGNYQNQIKFSELTIDMFRILQSLEREPLTQSQTKSTHVLDPTTSTDSHYVDEDGRAVRRTNPRKYLLYRPTFAQLMLYLVTSFKDIAQNSAMLLYLSADGSKRQRPDGSSLEYSGGVSTSVINAPNTKQEKFDTDENALVHTLHPADLIPLTRKPLFVIVDSTNSIAFKELPKIFDKPFACLLSPTEYPSSIKDTTPLGGLFTLFLHCPIKAFTAISDITQVLPDVWTQALAHLNETEKIIAESIEADPELNKSYKRFIQDDFLRLFCTRYVLTSAILSSHINFKDPKHRPSASPEFPAGVMNSPQLMARIEELAKLCSVSQFYSFADAAAPAVAAV